MRLKAQNEMAGFWPHAAMGPVERVVRRQRGWPGQTRHGAATNMANQKVRILCASIFVGRAQRYRCDY
jgi:hypothetical protein